MNNVYNCPLHSQPKSEPSPRSVGKLLLTISLFLLGQIAFGQVSGIVFRDYNANGVKGVHEIGVEGVSVKATNASGTVYGPVNSSSNGSYTLSGVPNGENVRVEFTIPATVGCYNEKMLNGPSSGTNGTSVQFVVGGVSNANFAIHNPIEHATDNPTIITTCFVAGSLLLDKTKVIFGTQVGVSDMEAIVSTKYNNTKPITDGSLGLPRSNNSPPVTPNNTYLAQAKQVGAVWGVAYQRETKKMFTSAVMKRSAQFGPLGTGGIYMVDNADGSSFSTSASLNFIDLKTIGVDTGPDSHVLTDPNDPNSTDLGQVLDQLSFCDARTFDKVGKIGIGDIDLSDNGEFMYVTNLNDRTIYKIEIGNPAITPTASKITAYSSAPWLVTPPCTGGLARPWGIKYYKGKVYVGVVCTAETSQQKSDLKAFIYEMDATTETWVSTPVLTIPLNYTKGKAADGTNTGATDKGTSWNPWIAFQTDPGNNNGNYSYPTPIVSDIEFDVDGSMIVGLMDRTGHQVGLGQAWVLQDGSCVKDPNRGFGPYISVNSGGDILRAGKLSSCLWQLENNANDGLKTSSGASNGQGIGGGEFYNGEYLGGGADNHQETFVGGLALQPGKNQLLGTVYDPFGFVSGGINFFDNTTGDAIDRYEVFPPQTAPLSGKANGLGDVELLNPTAPIEIGNRVWIDTDGDGTQDADELPLAGIKVDLCLKSAATTVVATATTDANGNYYFSSATGTSTGSAKYGVAIAFNSDYILKFPTTSGTKALTTLDLGANDVLDSDADATGNVAFKTGFAGQNIHSYDVGYVDCVKPTAIQLSKTAATCTGATPNNNGKITLTSATGADKCGISTIGAATYDGPAYASATAYSANKDVKTAIPNTGGKYILRLFNGKDDCFKDTTITVAAALCQTDCPNATMLVAEVGDNGAGFSSKIDVFPFPQGNTTTVLCNLPDGVGGEGIAIDPLKKIAYLIGTRGGVSVFSIDSGKVIKTYNVGINNNGASADIVLSADGKYLYAATDDGIIRVNPADGTGKKTYFSFNFQNSSGNLWGIDICPLDGRLLVSKAYDNSDTETSIELADSNMVNTNAGPIATLLVKKSDGKGTYRGVKFDKSNDGTFWAVYAGKVGTTTPDVLYHYNKTGAVIEEFNFPAAPTMPFDAGNQPFDIAFGPDGNIYITSFRGPCVIKFDYTTKKFSTYIPLNPGSLGKGLAFVCDGFTCPGCKKPVISVRATDPTCLAAGKIELTAATGGDKYGISNGATYAGPAYASATALPTTFPAVIKATISNGADSLFTVRVFNAKNDCFKDTTISVKATPVKPTIIQQSGGSPFCRTGGSTYTIKFTATGGTVVTTPSFPVTGDSVGNIPIATASVKLVVTSAGGCKDSITVAAPNCEQPCFKPAIGSPKPASQTLCQGQAAELYTFADPSDNNYQWYSFTNSNTTVGTAIPGATGTFTPTAAQLPPADGNTYYYAVIATAKTGPASCSDTLWVAMIVKVCLGSIGDKVFKDADKDGVQDAGEAGVNGVKVILTTTAGAFVDSTRTAAGGKYLFSNLPKGNYIVEFVKSTLPADCNAFTAKDSTSATDATDSDADKVTGKTGPIVLDPKLLSGTSTAADSLATNNMTVDAGLVAPLQLKGSLGNYVWKDANNNGINDEPASAGVKDVKLKLLNAAGNYVATGVLAGNQEVPAVATPATGFVTTALDTTTNTLTVKLNYTGLTSAPTMAHIHSGVTGVNGGVAVALSGFPTTTTASYNTTVTLNATQKTQYLANGLYVNIHTSTNPGGEIRAQLNACAITDASGKYLFTNLDSASYRVAVVQSSIANGCVISAKPNVATPADSTDSDFNPTTGISDAVTVDPKDPTKKDITTVDLAIVTPLGSIGDKVFKDANKDGKQDTGEAGVNGVTVNLLNSAGTVLETTTTAGGGKYLFSNLPKGNYVVEFVKSTLPADCNAFTAKDTTGAGVTDATDSDADKVTGKSGTVSLDPKVLSGTSTPADSLATNNLTVDAGLLPLTPLGSIGDKVFKDANKDGKQDTGEAGVNGVKVILTTTAGAFVDSTRTAAGGKYLFSNLPKGNYIVEFVKSTLPADCNAFTAKDSTSATDATDSDADKVTGKTGPIVLDPKLLSGTSTAADSLATNNMTVDAGLLPLTPLGSIGDKVFVDANKDGKQDAGEAGVDGVTVNLLNASGAVIGTTTTAGGGKYLFPNLPAGIYSVEFVKSTIPAVYAGFTAKDTAGVSEALNSDADKITGKTEQVTLAPVLNPTIPADSAATFNFTLDAGVIQKPDVNCVTTPPTSALGPNVFVCKDTPYPTLKATVVGTGTVDWYKTATGGTAVATGTLEYTPTANVVANDTFYLAARSTLPNSADCPVVTERTQIVVVAQNCAVEIDLALKKSINTKIAKLGDELTYTIKVYNQLSVPATGVEVTDTIATTVQFVAGSFVASRGSATITGNVIKWNIGGINASPDTVTLTYKVKATQQGVHFNTAEISKTNEKDKDSTPGNGKNNEDDIDRQCFTVPFTLCPTEKVSVTVPGPAVVTAWFKQDKAGDTPVAQPNLTGNTVMLDAVGIYTFTASNAGCPASGCCPIIIEPGTNCCPANICVPFTITKKKKK